MFNMVKNYINIKKFQVTLRLSIKIYKAVRQLAIKRLTKLVKVIFS